VGTLSLAVPVTAPRPQAATLTRVPLTLSRKGGSRGGSGETVPAVPPVGVAPMAVITRWVGGTTWEVDIYPGLLIRNHTGRLLACSLRGGHRLLAAHEQRQEQRSQIEGEGHTVFELENDAGGSAAAATEWAAAVQLVHSATQPESGLGSGPSLQLWMGSGEGWSLPLPLTEGAEPKLEVGGWMGNGWRAGYVGTKGASPMLCMGWTSLVHGHAAHGSKDAKACIHPLP
jgi:hypothetical protein